MAFANLCGSCASQLKMWTGLASVLPQSVHHSVSVMSWGWTLSNQCFSLLLIFSSYFNFSSNNCCTRYTDLAVLFFWSSCRKILEVRSSFCGFAGIFRHNSHCAKKKFVVISLNHKLFSFLRFSSSVPGYIYNDHFKLYSMSLSVVLGPQYVLFECLMFWSLCVHWLSTQLQLISPSEDKAFYILSRFLLLNLTLNVCALLKLIY